MFVPFDSLPDDARVWVYGSSRAFTPAEEVWLTTELTRFCNQWAAHQVPLHASFQLSHRQFIVLAVDEHANGASGCSIDASVHALQQIQQHLGTDLFDRKQLAFYMGGAVVRYPMTQIQALVNAGTLAADSLYFNQLVADAGSWRRGGLQRLDQSWLSRYLPKPVAVSAENSL
jgi:hypothetical protein